MLLCVEENCLFVYVSILPHQAKLLLHVTVLPRFPKNAFVCDSFVSFSLKINCFCVYQICPMFNLFLYVIALSHFQRKNPKTIGYKKDTLCFTGVHYQIEPPLPATLYVLENASVNIY